MGIGFNPFPIKYKHPSKFKDRQWLDFISLPYPLQFYRELVVIPPVTPIDTSWTDEYELSPEEMPYLVMFATDGSFNGIVGVLIGLDTVLLTATATQYLSDTAAGATITAHVGGVLTDFSDEQEQQEPKAYQVHESWNPTDFTNDVGFCYFSAPFTSSTFVNVVGYTDTDEGTYVEPTTQVTVGGTKYVDGTPSLIANLTTSVQARFSVATANTLGLSFTVTSAMIPMQDGDTSLYTGLGSPLLANNGNGGDYLTGVNMYPGDVTNNTICIYTNIASQSAWVDVNTGIPPNPGT